MTTETHNYTPEDLAKLDEINRGRRTVAVKLTPEEWEAASVESAEVFNAIQVRRAEEKNRRDIFNADQKALEVDHARLAKLVFDKAENREVDTITLADIDANLRIVVRRDTYEIVHTDALKADEREEALQKKLPLGNEDDDLVDDEGSPDPKPKPQIGGNEDDDLVGGLPPEPGDNEAPAKNL